MTPSPMRAAAEAFRRAKRAIAVTGAGISAESGIPTFRDAGGIWEKYPPEEYASIGNYLAAPEKVWAFWRELAAGLADCRPNPGHLALAKLEAMGLLEAIITQNVDNLHQEAGSRRVIEYHGNARYLICLDCAATEPLPKDSFPERPPDCPRCRHLMKPGVVMFGEMIPVQAMIEAEALARGCDLCLIVGTSAQVFPAAGLPEVAKRQGACVIEVNIEPTDFTFDIVDYFLQGPAGTILSQVTSEIKSMSPP